MGSDAGGGSLHIQWDKAEVKGTGDATNFIAYRDLTANDNSIDLIFSSANQSACKSSTEGGIFFMILVASIIIEAREMITVFSKAVFSTEVFESSYYKVCMIWGSVNLPYRHSQEVPVFIEHDDGISKVMLNQNEESNTWKSIGIYHFLPSKTYKISIETKKAMGDTSVVVGNIRFERLYAKVHDSARTFSPIMKSSGKTCVEPKETLYDSSMHVCYSFETLSNQFEYNLDTRSFNYRAKKLMLVIMDKRMLHVIKKLGFILSQRYPGIATHSVLKFATGVVFTWSMIQGK